MQAILERNAAEARAKQRDMERYRYEKKFKRKVKILFLVDLLSFLEINKVAEKLLVMLLITNNLNKS